MVNIVTDGQIQRSKKNTVALKVLIYWLCPAKGIESEPSIEQHNSNSSTVFM